MYWHDYTQSNSKLLYNVFPDITNNKSPITMWLHVCILLIDQLDLNYSMIVETTSTLGHKREPDVCCTINNNNNNTY